MALTGVGSASTPFTFLASNFNNCSIRGWCNYVRYNKTSCCSIIYCRLGKQYCFFFNQIIFDILSICMLNLAIFDIPLPKKKTEIKTVSYFLYLFTFLQRNALSRATCYQLVRSSFSLEQPGRNKNHFFSMFIHCAVKRAQ